MDYQKFMQQLPELYENLGQESVHPKSEQFQSVLDRVEGKTTANIMQLLNFAVECMEPDELYCEIGCSNGANLIGSLLNHSDQIAYAVDDFSGLDDAEEKLEILSNNLSLFNLEEQVLFCDQNFEEFFFDLKESQSDAKIGVYFYSGNPDYRSQLLGLLLVKPFLANPALIIVNNTNWSSVQQANWDFIATHPDCQLLLNLPTPTENHFTFGNGIQILSYDMTQESHYNWSEYSQKFRNPPLIQAISDLHNDFEFTQKPQAVNTLYKEALYLHHIGDFFPAEKKYKEVLQWHTYHADVLHDLGIVYYNLQQYQNCLSHLLQSLAIDPASGLHHYSLGLVLEKIGNIPQAIEAYQKSIRLNPKLINAYNNLGVLLCQRDQFQEAESVYRQAVTANPSHFGSYINLGNLLLEQHRNIEEAIELYQKALQLKPRDPDVMQNLGIAYDLKHDPAKSAFYFGNYAHIRQNYEAAIEQYEKGLKTQIGKSSIYINLADCYEKLNQEEKAINTYHEGLKYYPKTPRLYFCLIVALQNFGHIHEAITVASQAAQLLPNDLILKIEEQRLLPIIYDTPEEINFYRRRFIQYLEVLIEQTALDSPEAIENAKVGIGARTNFYLQYQGKDDLDLQKRYGEFVHQVMAANYPEWVKPLPMPPRSQNGKIRIGYISNAMYSHTVSKLLRGWPRNHNQHKFELYCYTNNVKIDAITQQFAVYSHAFYHIPGGLEELCQQILSDQLHILVFLDIGMHPTITQIAGLRLAPVQCTTWGHPITSGLPTIDYFLSSDLMEPENGENHYSEQLIRLPNIGISYSKPALPKTRKRRSDFKLRSQAVVYLSCQSTFKYLPQYDYIFAAIAQRVPQAQFVFISHPSDSITQQFFQRLKKAFAGFGLDSEDYCVTLSRLNQNDYLSLNLVSDVFLDTLSWSGGNTTLEAIACNLPVVTCPGEFMRGRHSYGILRMLGVTETIAKDEAEYIDIAVRLGLDPQWRKSIVEKVVANHDRLYEDKTCVEALEAFYERVVEEYPRKPDFT